MTEKMNRHGRGKNINDDGDIYDGQWKDDDMTNGIINYVNGDVYKGECSYNGNRNGTGKMVYKDGRVEEGLWKWNQFKGNKIQK